MLSGATSSQKLLPPFQGLKDTRRCSLSRRLYLDYLSCFYSNEFRRNTFLCYGGSDFLENWFSTPTKHRSFIFPQTHTQVATFSNVASEPRIRSSSLLIVQMNILRAVLFSTFLRTVEVSEFPRYPLLHMPAALEEPCQETSGTVFSTKGNKYASGGDAHLLQSGPLKGFKFQTLPSNREQLDF